MTKVGTNYVWNMPLNLQEILGHSLVRSSKTETNLKNDKYSHFTITRIKRTHRQWCWTNNREPIYTWSEYWGIEQTCENM